MSIPAISHTTHLLSWADLGTFYTAMTGCTPDPTYFGAYALQPVGDQLYIGFGTGRPAEYDGALLARTNGRALNPVGVLQEQGFVAMQYADGRLYFPGPDPMEDWTRGNVYTLNLPDAIQKHRTLVNVIHTWGLYKDTATGRLYAAVGQHTGDNVTYFGSVWASEDEGETWQAPIDPKHTLGRYRTYDVIQFDADLYAIANDVYEGPSYLVRSRDQGETWRRLATQVECRPRLFATVNYLVALQYGREGLYLLDAAGRSRKVKFDGFRAAEWAYNYIAADGRGWYYLLAEGGKVMCSRNLRTWSLHAETGLTLNALAYWPAQQSLIVADRGAQASLYTLPPAG